MTELEYYKMKATLYESNYKEIEKYNMIEYKDFMNSINDQMDLELGEIYREMLKIMFKRLEKHNLIIK